MEESFIILAQFYVFLAKMDVKHIKIEYYLPFEVITQPYFFDHRHTVARDMSVTF